MDNTISASDRIDTSAIQRSNAEIRNQFPEPASSSLGAALPLPAAGATAREGGISCPRCKFCRKKLVKKWNESVNKFADRLFCDKFCRGKAQSKGIVVKKMLTRNCLICGTTFKREKAPRGHTQPKCCSPACGYEAQKETNRVRVGEYVDIRPLDSHRLAELYGTQRYTNMPRAILMEEQTGGRFSPADPWIREI